MRRWVDLPHFLVLVGLLSLTMPLLGRPVPPTEQLEKAINIYDHGGYLEAAALLNKLLYPLKLSRTEDIVKAKVYLGLCYYILGKRDEAGMEFRGVFKLDPDYQPDPLYIPEEVIAFINQFRPSPPPPPRRTDVQGLGETIEASDQVPFQFHAANLLPLGIPQLRNGDRAKGLSLMLGEISLLALNIGSYYYLQTYNDPNGVPPDRYPYLLTAKVTNISTFSLLALTVIYGMSDALYRYPPGQNDVGASFHIRLGDRPSVVLSIHRRF